MKIRNCILALAIILLLLACVSYPYKQIKVPTPTWPSVPTELTDRSWVTDQPCKPPCWYGMVVGETMMSQAFESVEAIELIQPEPAREYPVGYFDIDKNEYAGDGRGFMFKCVQPAAWECVGLEFVNETLIGIRMFPNYKINFGEVVKTIGPPDYIRNHVHGGPEKATGCTIEMIWVERQLLVGTMEWYEDSGRELCKLFYESGRRPYPDLIVDMVQITNSDFINRVEKVDWTGFANP